MRDCSKVYRYGFFLFKIVKKIYWKFIFREFISICERALIARFIPLSIKRL